MVLSKEDEALYDRQIRLWGRAAQQKIKESSIVIAGSFNTGVGHELLKNLALKGIGKIILITWNGLDTDFTNHDQEDCRLFGNIQAGHEIKSIQEHVKDLNPLVAQEHYQFNHINELDWNLIKQASIFILLNHQSYSDAKMLNEACRGNGICFSWLLTKEYNSLMINDLGANYQYSENIKKMLNNEQVTITLEHEIYFPSLESLWTQHHGKWVQQQNDKDANNDGKIKRKRSKALPVEYSETFALYQNQIKDGIFFNNFKEIAPVNAIMGAISAQEVVKTITRNDTPIHNVVLFDGRSLDSTILSIAYKKQHQQHNNSLAS